MNWFKRHLNWTASLVGLSWNILLIFKGIEAIPYALFFFPVYCWAVARKGRTLWWSLTFFIPLGWIAFLRLENRKVDEILDIKDGKIIARPRDEND